jgi:hypothetical protein
MVASVLTFRAFAEVWKVRRGCQLASGKDDIYRLSTICAFRLPGVEPATTLGDKSLDAITTDDVEVSGTLARRKACRRAPSITI